MTPRAAVPSALEALVSSAAATVEQLEATPLDQPWAEPFTAAEAAIDALHQAAHVVVFPRALQPASAAAIADFDLLFQDSRYTTLLSDALEVHDAAVATYPELTELIRSSRLRRQLTKLDLSTEAFDQAIAAQLAAVDQFQPHSGILAHAVPDLRRRLETQCETRQTVAERAIAERAVTEAEVARVRQEAFARRRQELAARAERLPQSLLAILPGRDDPTTVRTVRELILQAETHERLDTLEQAIAGAEAARAVQ